MNLGVKSILAAAVLALGSTATAQPYPARPITIVVPFGAGGPADTVARHVSQGMSRLLKQQIVIENVGGAGGNIGAERVAKALPDGYTLMLTNSGIATNPSLYRNLPYNPLTDFESIGVVTENPMGVTARGSFPSGDFKEFLAYLKGAKNNVRFATAGVGSLAHLCGLLLMRATRSEFIMVPYKGTAQAMNDVMGGHVDVLCSGITDITSQVRGDKLKVYGVTSRTRVAALPTVPTLDEQGLRGFEMVVWNALFAPRSTPRPILETVAASMRDAVRDPALRATLEKLGSVPPVPERATPAGLAALLKSDIELWGPVLKSAGVRPQ